MDNIAGALYLKRKGIVPTRVAAINQNYAWGQDSWADFKSSIDVIFNKPKVVSNNFQKYLLVNMELKYLPYWFQNPTSFTLLYGVEI